MTMTDRQILDSFNAPKDATLVQTFKNGNIKIKRRVVCDRCNNKNGIYYIGVCNGQPVPSHVDQGVCFKCLGSGFAYETEILMTPENRAKADAKAEKERAKRIEEAKKIEAERQAEEARKQAEQEAKEKELAEKKARSQYFGEIGQRIEREFTLVHSHHFEVPSFAGFGMDSKYIHILQDEDGNTFTWKTTKSIYIPNGDYTFNVAEKGDKVTLKGTIKAHSEYKDEKQTELTRCKCITIVHKETEE